MTLPVFKATVNHCFYRGPGEKEDSREVVLCLAHDPVGENFQTRLPGGGLHATRVVKVEPAGGLDVPDGSTVLRTREGEATGCRYKPPGGKAVEWKPGFGETLQHLREAANLTFRDLADASGVSHQRIHQLEAGTHRPRWDEAQALASALGVSTDTFRDS